jgi:predicted  nucleic acid-binding Zn-ribbon protein
MPVAKQLYELQEIDTDIEHTRQTLDIKKGQLGNRDVMDASSTHLANAHKALEELKHRRRDAEFELADAMSKISEAEKQLYGGKITNSKELSNLQHEINTLKALSDKLETKTLETIDKAEDQEKTVANLTANHRKIEETWGQEQKQVAADIELLNKTLANLTEQRQSVVTQIESTAVSLYEKVRRQKKPAVSKVEQGICRACRISQSASTLQKARGGQPIQCGTCGRILFIS